MPRRTAGVMVCVACGISLSAQRPTELKRTGSVATSEIAASLVVPVKCDPDENPVARIAADTPGAGPVISISRDGKRVTRFSLEATPDRFQQARISDFAVGPNGALYLLVRLGPDAHVLRFDSSGRFSSEFQVSEAVGPTQIAVFKTGDLLIAGGPPPNLPTNLAHANAFIGIFNESGQLYRKLDLPKDVGPAVELKEKSPVGDARGKVAPRDRTFEEAIALSSMELADDGNIYLMRHTPSGPIYAIGPAGDIRNRISLNPPKGAYLSAVKVARGRLAAEFIQNKPDSYEIESVILQVVDLQTGGTVGEYFHSDSGIGSALACYVPDEFTFLANDDKGRLMLTEAVAP